MTSFAKSRTSAESEYPSSDGKPMAETEIHLLNMLETIGSLREFWRERTDIYVAGNMLMYYEPGNKRKHVSPDVFVVRGLDKHIRPNYLVWQEGKAPDLVIELTSSSTRKKDTDKKFKLYRDILKVSEYFLFDPTGDYLKPRLQGFRLFGGQYAEIRSLNNRLPSKIMDLHLESNGNWLRLYDPIEKEWLPMREESEQAAMKRGEKRGEQQGEQRGMQRGMQQGMQQGIEQGIRQGIEQGIRQGQEEMYNLVKDQLRERFPSLSEAMLKKLDELPPGKLMDLGRALFKAKTLAELGFEEQ